MKSSDPYPCRTEELCARCGIELRLGEQVQDVEGSKELPYAVSDWATVHVVCPPKNPVFDAEQAQKIADVIEGMLHDSEFSVSATEDAAAMLRAAIVRERYLDIRLRAMQRHRAAAEKVVGVARHMMQTKYPFLDPTRPETDPFLVAIYLALTEYDELEPTEEEQ